MSNFDWIRTRSMTIVPVLSPATVLVVGSAATGAGEALLRCCRCIGDQAPYTGMCMSTMFSMSWAVLRVVSHAGSTGRGFVAALNGFYAVKSPEMSVHVAFAQMLQHFG